MSDEAIAARWFGVRAEFEVLGRARMGARAARELVGYVLTAGSVWIELMRRRTSSERWAGDHDSYDVPDAQDGTSTAPAACRCASSW
jgi:hypothetical protein